MDPSEKALVRLQVLTPLSILISLAANLVAALVISPSLARINDDYLTILTPRKSLIGAYWLVLYCLQIGYCILLSMAHKEETKATIVNAVGLRFVFANAALALWTLFWELRIFLASEICLLVALVLMISIWGHLLLYPAAKSRPIDLLFIHAPMRLLLVVLLVVEVWQNGLLAFRWYKYVGSEPHSPERPGRWEGEHDKHSWIAFGVIASVGLISAFIVFIRRDAIWAFATVFLYISLLLKGPKPAPVFIPLVLLSVLQLVALISSVLYFQYRTKREGAIRLPDEDEEGGFAARAHRHTASGDVPEDFTVSGLNSQGPREIE